MNAPRLRRRVLSTLVALSAFAVLPAQAQTVTLRLHHFLPPQAAIPATAITPWAKKIETESGGPHQGPESDARALMARYAK